MLLLQQQARGYHRQSGDHQSQRHRREIGGIGVSHQLGHGGDQDQAQSQQHTQAETVEPGSGNKGHHDDRGVDVGDKLQQPHGPPGLNLHHQHIVGEVSAQECAGKPAHAHKQNRSQKSPVLAPGHDQGGNGPRHDAQSMYEEIRGPVPEQAIVRANIDDSEPGRIDGAEQVGEGLNARQPQAAARPAAAAMTTHQIGRASARYTKATATPGRVMRGWIAADKPSRTNAHGREDGSSANTSMTKASANSLAVT